MKSNKKPLTGEMYRDIEDGLIYIWDGEGWRIVGNIPDEEIKQDTEKMIEEKYKRAMRIL